jgi:hypothetical protein
VLVSEAGTELVYLETKKLGLGKTKTSFGGVQSYIEFQAYCQKGLKVREEFVEVVCETQPIIDVVGDLAEFLGGQ